MVHNSKARIQNLSDFIVRQVVGQKSFFEVSDVKRDGTVFVRFRSGDGALAGELALSFGRHLDQANVTYQKVDFNKFRLHIAQF